MADIAAEDKKTESSPSSKPLLARKSRRRSARIVVPIVILILLLGGYFVWKHFNAYESTDDAQIDGHINAISARISGNVIQVLTDDVKYAKAGEVLVRIDPNDYQVAVAKAEADLADAVAALQGSRTDIPITSINTASQLKVERMPTRPWSALSVNQMRPRHDWIRRKPRYARPRRITKKPATM